AKISCAMYSGVSWSHSARISSVGTRIISGSHVALPAPQYSAMSLSTPFGARTTGGFCFAPTGSVARLAFHHASNDGVGLTCWARCGGIPRMPRWRAASCETTRYAPDPLKGGGALRCHSGAYSNSLLTLSLLFIV